MLSWFQCNDGQIFLETQIEKDSRWLKANSDFFHHSDVATDELFNRIEKSTNESGIEFRLIRKIALVILIAGIVSFVLNQQNQLWLFTLLAVGAVIWLFLSKTAFGDKYLR